MAPEAVREAIAPRGCLDQAVVGEEADVGGDRDGIADRDESPPIELLREESAFAREEEISRRSPHGAGVRPPEDATLLRVEVPEDEDALDGIDVSRGVHEVAAVRKESGKEVRRIAAGAVERRCRRLRPPGGGNAPERCPERGAEDHRASRSPLGAESGADPFADRLDRASLGVHAPQPAALKKPMVRPSGDQNGKRAPSAPSIRRGARVSRAWTQSCSRPPGSMTTNASRLPSAESAGRSWGRSFRPGGALNVNRIGWGGGALGRVRSAAAAPTSPAAARPQASDSRVRRRVVRTAGAATPAAEPSAIHASSRRTSAALCQRSSGSLARQVLTTRSRAGGDIGCAVEIGAGSADMIAVISDAWFDAANAFVPVTIS